jgi:aspartate kinase
MRVMKFGGAALRDGPAIECSARLVEHAGRSGRVLVVVSAQEGVTRALERAAEAAAADAPWAQGARGAHPDAPDDPGTMRELSPWDGLRVRHRTTLAQLGLPADLLDRHLFELRAILEALRAGGRSPNGAPDRRMRDYVLSFGERMSARIFAAVLRAHGVSSAPLDAYDLGLTTVSREGEGALLLAPSPALRAQLEAVPGIPVVTGFLALDAQGHLTTLGPNGSDLTAVWFGEAVGADEVVLWKSVEGFMTADPDVVPEARCIPALGRHEAVEFAIQGADILHAGALEPAERGGIVVRVADVRAPDAAGSRIEARTPARGPLGIALRESLALYRETLHLGRDQGGQLAELLAQLVACGLEPCSAAFSGREAVALVADGERAAAFAARRSPRAVLERGRATFALVGRDVGDDPVLDARIRALAGRAGIALEPPPGAASPSSRAYLVPAAALTDVVRAVHAGLFGAVPAPGGDLLVPHAPDALRGVAG